MQNLVSNAIFISSPLLLSYFPFLSNCRVKHFFFLLFFFGEKNLNNLSVFWCIFPPSCTVEWREMGWRQTGGKAHESVFFFLFFIFPFFFFEWEEREQHAEEGKKRERRMAGRRQRG